MTGDETEREKRKQYLKDLLRTQRAMRQHLKAVRRPEWVRDFYRDADLRWEAEQELDREEAEAAVKRRQQEVEAPVDPLSPKLELREAKDEEIRNAVRTVYGRYARGAGPNLADIYPLVRDELEKLGLTATKQRIQDIAAEKEFDGVRGQSGKRRT